MNQEKYMDLKMYTSKQLIDLTSDVISMLEGTNESVSDLSELEKKEVSESAANIIITTSINKIKLIDKYLKNN